MKSEIDAAEKKLDRPKRKEKDETSVTLIPMKEVDVKEIEKALKKIYGKQPGFAVAAIPDLKCLLLRADAKTSKEICDMIKVMLPW